jgi:hypothetical protein
MLRSHSVTQSFWGKRDNFKVVWSLPLHAEFATKYIMVILTTTSIQQQQPLRYGLVARIHRSHASADVAGVRFPVTEFLQL